MNTPERRFPIMHDTEIKSVPWEVMQPHELQTLRNHSQSLERLASRGGVTPEEAVAIIEGRPWKRMPFTEARDMLMGYVAKTRDPRLRPAEPTDIKRDPIREALELVRNMRDGRADKAKHNFNKLEILLERAL